MGNSLRNLYNRQFVYKNINKKTDGENPDDTNPENIKLINNKNWATIPFDFHTKPNKYEKNCRCIAYGDRCDAIDMRIENNLQLGNFENVGKTITDILNDNKNTKLELERVKIELETLKTLLISPKYHAEISNENVSDDKTELEKDEEALDRLFGPDTISNERNLATPANYVRQDE